LKLGRPTHQQPDQPLHVLHVVQLYKPVPSGASRYFEEIGQRLTQEGHRVTVLATTAFDLEHLWAPGRRSLSEGYDTHDGVAVYRLPVRRLPASRVLYPLVRRLMVEISRLPVPAALTVPLLHRLATLTPRLPTLPALLQSPLLADVSLVHTTNITLDFAIVPVLAWAEQRHIPHLCTPFTHLGEPHNKTVRRYYSMAHQIEILRRSALVITQTGLEQRFLQQAGLPPHQMRTIGVGVTPQELAGGDAARFRAAHAIQGPIVLTMGVAAYDKGTIHTLQALQQLWEQGIAATWVQIGPQMSHFNTFYRTLPPAHQQHTRVLGYVPDQTRRDALAAADVFVLPSRTDSFGIVYLEAWVYRVPVIGAWAGGVPDVITHGRDGLLVPFGDVAALADAIARLLHDRTLARALGALGYARVRQRYTWEHMYAQVRQAYLDSLGIT
jgi:glycosyltransferase involved in cell wall biosynthesis